VCRARSVHRYRVCCILRIDAPGTVSHIACGGLQKVKWADYTDFQHPDANEDADGDLATAPGEPDDPAAAMAGLDSQGTFPKLRLDWDAAHAIAGAADSGHTK
jgi:hypothetical protein